MNADVTEGTVPAPEDAEPSPSIWRSALGDGVQVAKPLLQCVAARAPNGPRFRLTLSGSSTRGPTHPRTPCSTAFHPHLHHHLRDFLRSEVNHVVVPHYDARTVQCQRDLLRLLVIVCRAAVNR